MTSISRGGKYYINDEYINVKGENLEKNFPDYVYLGDASRSFINRAKIITYQGTTAINLLDYFPLLKQGYTRKTIFTYLAPVYIDANNLRDINDTTIFRPDRVFNNAYGTNISADFYSEIKYNQLVRKIPMAEAIAERIIREYMNTYQVIEKSISDFNPEQIKTSSLSAIFALNYYETSDLSTLNNYLKDKEVRDALDDEYKLMSELFLLNKSIMNKQKSLSSIKNILYLAIENGNKMLAKQLLMDGKVDLTLNNEEAFFLAIQRGDPELVKLFLASIEIDPRINNNEAYRVAKETGNKAIMKLIGDAIIQRNYYQGQVIEQGLGVLGEENLVPNIKTYTSGLFR